MKTIPAPQEVDQLARDLVHLVNKYIEDPSDHHKLIGALNALAAAVAFFLVAAKARGYSQTREAWDPILERHTLAMQKLFDSVKEDP